MFKSAQMAVSAYRKFAGGIPAGIHIFRVGCLSSLGTLSAPWTALLKTNSVGIQGRAAKRSAGMVG